LDCSVRFRGLAALAQKDWRTTLAVLRWWALFYDKEGLRAVAGSIT
jgi:hypothetical protein